MNTYDQISIERELRNLLVLYGVEQVNLEWVKLLTKLESQIKTALKKDVVVVAAPEPPSVPAPTIPGTPVTDKKIDSLG